MGQAENAPGRAAVSSFLADVHKRKDFIRPTFHKGNMKIVMSAMAEDSSPMSAIYSLLKDSSSHQANLAVLEHLIEDFDRRQGQMEVADQAGKLQILCSMEESCCHHDD